MSVFTVNTPKPDEECFICKGRKYWWRPSPTKNNSQDGDWLCGVCHPNSNPNYIEPGYPQSKKENLMKENLINSEIENMRKRLADGNIKLRLALEKLPTIEPLSEYDRQNEAWRNAMNTLAILCSELMKSGFRRCLYIQDGHKCLLDENFAPGGCYFCPDQDFWFEHNFGREVEEDSQKEKKQVFLKNLLNQI